MVNEMSGEELLKAVKRIESLLLEFEFRTVGPCKRWKKNVVAKQRFTERLKEFNSIHVTFSPNVLNAAKSLNTLGIRKTKEEKNTNAVSLNVPYAKKT